MELLGNVVKAGITLNEENQDLKTLTYLSHLIEQLTSTNSKQQNNNKTTPHNEGPIGRRHTEGGLVLGTVQRWLASIEIKRSHYL